MLHEAPNALDLADSLECEAPIMPSIVAMLRTQHKQIAAYKLLTESQEAQLSQHRAQADKYREAVATLQSERDANALLTTAIERKDALLSRCLDAFETDDWMKKLTAAGEIRKELSQ